MPKLFTIMGYSVFFWSNEGEPLEPVHFHIGKTIGARTTKIWIKKDGTYDMANNESDVPSKDLKHILKILEPLADDIVGEWEQYFGVKARYIDE
jgi:hypothetical protein